MSQQFLKTSTERLLTSAPRPAVSRFSPKKLEPACLHPPTTTLARQPAGSATDEREANHAARQKIGVQCKLTVGAADDQYEQEADHVARQVMSMSDATASNATNPAISSEEEKDKTLQTVPLAASITPFAQRQMESTEEPEEQEAPVRTKLVEGHIGLQRQPEMEEEEKKKPIQAKNAESGTDSFEAGDDVESRLNQSKGGGSHVPDQVRVYIEPRFGMDFGHVRVHTGSESIHMNRDVGAKAFTHGSDIYYGADSSPADLALTAHELTHRAADGDDSWEVCPEPGKRSMGLSKRNKPNGKKRLAKAFDVAFSWGCMDGFQAV